MKTTEQRFFEKVEKTDSCWNWKASKNSKGYGLFNYKKVMTAHRFSWERINGKVPEGLCVLHRCDNRKCVNPDHLWVGTQLENIADRDAKGRQICPSGESNGNSILKEEQVIEIRKLNSGGVSYYKIAPMFNISERTVSQICRRLTWKHLP
jgi:DNA-binding CsgD family transcriptional regulator